ncbi:MAG TPA: methyltransferase domain-containing protein [Bryobacteraceae bacterium]|nr:methyltransferase domain-containing protein [Bryobacteraceae bacterium]
MISNDRTKSTLPAEIERLVRSLDTTNQDAQNYLHIHMERIVRTLSITPLPQCTGAVLELGAYMHMTPALQRVLGYQEVRGAYFGPLGRTDRKSVTVGGEVIFECDVDLFDAEKDIYPYGDGRFDCVLACEIFEHFIHDPMHMLFECRRVLVPTGYLVLTTPNVASYTAVARVLESSGNPQLFSKYANPKGEFADTEIPHVREYTPAELREALNCAGFEVETLFTEVAPGYRSNTWVGDFLKRNNFPADLRGEQMYVVARKSQSRTLQRYPGFLYEM